MSHPTWPLFDLIVRTPRLELRLPRENELVDLVDSIDERIYERTGFLPFHIDWTGDHIASMKFHWKSRADWTPDSWTLPLSPFVDGRAVGTQDISGAAFPTVRRVDTGSWLHPDVQGTGLGTEARAAVLHLAFEGLGALEAHSKAHVDNHASNAVSRKLGYEVTHREGALFGDVRGEVCNLVLRRDVWEQHRRHDIEIIGLDSCRGMFGI